MPNSSIWTGKRLLLCGYKLKHIHDIGESKNVQNVFNINMINNFIIVVTNPTNDVINLDMNF